MKISKRQLIKMGACKGGLKRFIDQTNNTSELVDVASLVGGKNTYDDLLWLAEETISKERIVRLACDCALLNIELIKPYVNGYNYNLIVEFLKDPSKNADSVNATKVANSSDAIGYSAESVNADNAAYAARAASYAAESVNAANVASSAAYAATYDTFYAAFYAAVANGKEVNKLLIEMFNEVNT